MKNAHGKATIINQIQVEIAILKKYFNLNFWIFEITIKNIHKSAKIHVQIFIISGENSGILANQIKKIADSKKITHKAVFQLKIKNDKTHKNAKISIAVVIFIKNAVHKMNHQIAHFIFSSKEISWVFSWILSNNFIHKSNKIKADQTINKNKVGSIFISSADWKVIIGIK